MKVASTKFKKASPRSGFTLVEMLVTIAVAAILISVASPSFSSLLSKYRLSADNANLLADLLLARSEAIRQATTVSVCQSNNGTTCTATGWGSGRIVFVDGGTAGQVDSNDTVLKVSAPIVAGNTMNANFPGSFVQYSATGAASVSGVITTCRSAFSGLQVVIQPVGRTSAIKLTGVCP